MGFDPGRVVEVYSEDAAGTDRVGSGYLVSDQVVLTADHVVAGLPVQPTDPSGLERCEVRPLGLQDWLPARVVQHDAGRDVALLRLAADWRPPAGSPAPGWGRLDGVEPVGCMAVGFPWAQARPDQVRDTEHLFGQIAPLTTAKAGRLAVNVVTAPPTARPDRGSPWAGMSGAALFAGPYLVGVVVVDPRRYGTDRLQATPISALDEFPDWWQAVGIGGVPELVGVGPRFRLAVTQDLSLVLAPPYRPLPAGLAFTTAPVRLLLPEHGIVPFLGRQQLLDDLQAWCDPTPGSLGVQMLTGTGGSGKTRLAAELCVRLRGAGWDAGFADVSTPNGQTKLGFERPTLLVIDDADFQMQLSTAIVNWLVAQPHRPPLRLLLLARSQGAWWEQLSIQTDGLAEDYAAPPRSLEAGALTIAERERHRDTAAAVFAAQLPGEYPTVEVPVLTDPEFANPLLVHMSVLLALLGQPVTTASGGNPRTKVLQRLLNRERKRWTNSLPGAVLSDLSHAVATQAVSLATLTSPQTRPETVALLRAVPDLAEADLERRGRIADWLHQLYPGQASYVAPLRPDLLAEQHLADTPDLAQLTRNAYQHTTSYAQVAQLLAELIRAARTHPAAQTALDQLLDSDFPELFDQAVGAPTSPIPGALTQALQLAPHPEAAAQLVGRLPQRSTALAALAATIRDQAVQHYRTLAEGNPDAYLPDLAVTLTNLGKSLSEVGQRQQALASAQEAIAIYRQLAKANPDAYLPDLATALTNISAFLSEMGQRQQALASAQEAITIYRQVVQANPDAYLPDLASALGNLGASLSDLGQRQQALASAQEYTDIYRQLAKANPDAYLPDLASGLNNLGVFLSEMGQRQQALAPAQEGVTIYRTLAEANPDAYLPDLARALNNLGIHQAEVGQRQQALAPAQEAIDIYRQLADANPDAYLPNLASALNNLGIRQAEVGQRQQALAPAQEATTVYRQLAEANPDAYLPYLARALGNLGASLSYLGQRQHALAATQEATTIHRTLVQANPDAYLPHLAMALTNLGIRLAEVSRQEEALAPTQEATAIYRALAEANPDAYLPYLARAVNKLGIRLAEVGRQEEALTPAQEATAIYRALAEANPDAYLPGLATALTNLGNRLAEVGQPQQALATDQEAVITYRQLAKVNSDAYLPDLATALTNLGMSLSEVGRPEKALAPTQEAVTISRQLVEANPDAYLPDLATALTNLEDQLAAAGREDDVAEVQEELAAIRERVGDEEADSPS
jgi:hypothetical protein